MLICVSSDICGVILVLLSEMQTSLEKFFGEVLTRLTPFFCKLKFLTVFKVPPEEFKHCSEDQFAEILGGLYNNFEVKVMGPVELPSSTSWETNSEYSSP